MADAAVGAEGFCSGLDQVSSYYGPGVVLSWIITIATTYIRLALTKTSPGGASVVESIAILGYPAVAAVDVIRRAWVARWWSDEGSPPDCQGLAALAVTIIAFNIFHHLLCLSLPVDDVTNLRYVVTRFLVTMNPTSFTSAALVEKDSRYVFFFTDSLLALGPYIVLLWPDSRTRRSLRSFILVQAAWFLSQVVNAIAVFIGTFVVGRLSPGPHPSMAWYMPIRLLELVLLWRSGYHKLYNASMLDIDFSISPMGITTTGLFMVAAPYCAIRAWFWHVAGSSRHPLNIIFDGPNKVTDLDQMAAIAVAVMVVLATLAPPMLKRLRPDTASEQADPLLDDVEMDASA